jgi:cytochrome c
MVLLGCAGPANRTVLPAGETETGRKIYYAKCAKCHKFYDPKQYSDEEWNMWMGKMKKKAKLSDEQERMLLTYIDTTLRGDGKTQKSSTPPSVPK